VTRAVLALVGLIAAASVAGADGLNESDREAIRAVIARQIEAFRRDDPAGAFAFAAPGIKAKFGTPARFMDMVRSGYRPLLQPGEVRFAALDESGPQPVQSVVVVGADGVIHSVPDATG